MKILPNKSIIISTGLAALFLFIACDDRVPTESGGDYVLQISTTYFAENASGNEVPVGEDLVGEDSYTYVVVRLLKPVTTNNLDGSTGYEAVAGKEISFSATSGGSKTGTFDPAVQATDKDGYATVRFDDSEEAGTVTITAQYLDIEESTTIQVIDVTQTPVWPYRLFVNTSPSTIQVDNGATQATITAQLRNKDYNAVSGVMIQYQLDRDDIAILSNGTSMTDTVGDASVELTDTGNPSDIGTVLVVATYEHPVFGTLSDSAQVIIASPTDYQISITSSPISGTTPDWVVVGEDVSGPDAYTLLTVYLSDQNNQPVGGELIVFSTNQSGGTFDISTPRTNSYGMTTVLYSDNGSAIDNPGTPNYEGVTITAELNDEVQATSRFSVYGSETEVWPYRVILSTDTDVIELDNGETVAQITARILNQVNRPLKNLEVAFEASKGHIDETGMTDSTGTVQIEFTDLGNPDDVGISTITAAFDHPAFGLVSDSILISIEDPSFSGTPAYIEIPPSIPNEIMVVGGGGRESTQLRAEVYDENGVLVDTPTRVQFSIGPNVPQGANINNVGLSDTAYTVNGIASVSLNSGIRPGTIRATARVNLADSTTISATRDNQIVIVTGPPVNIFPDADPNSIEPIGGGLYQFQLAAMVRDLWYNPVSDSNHVYWTMSPADSDADSSLDGIIDGVSFTGNENLDGNTYKGIAYTTCVYPSRDIFSIAEILAYCYGGDIDNDGVYGDSVGATVENDVLMPFYPGTVTLSVTPTFWDFTTNGNPAQITATVNVIDYYGNPVEFGTVLLGATGAAAISDDGVGITNAQGQVQFSILYDQGICTPIPDSDPVQYNEFTSTVNATLLDPISTSSEPQEILFIRSLQ